VATRIFRQAYERPPVAVQADIPSGLNIRQTVRMADELIGLEEVIRTIRAELTAAMLEDAGGVVRFRPGPVELEFLVQVSREKGADGGVKFWVISIGGSAKATSSTTHRIKVTLDPLDPNEERASGT
jgi:hypothetical protein